MDKLLHVPGFTTIVAVSVHPLASVTVTEYVPADKLEIF